MFAKGGEKWYDPDTLIQRKRMIFSAIIMGIFLLSISVYRNDTFFSWPATLLEGEQETKALEIVHSFVLLIGTYFTMMLIILTIPPLIALEMDIQLAAKLHFNEGQDSQDDWIVIDDANFGREPKRLHVISVEDIEKWRTLNGLTLPARRVIISLLGSLTPMLMTPFATFLSEVLKKIGAP